MSEAINKYWEGEEISWGEPLSEPKSLLSSEVPREENKGQKTKMNTSQCVTWGSEPALPTGERMPLEKATES